MKRGLRIAVDARPLAFPNSGIGRYTACLLRAIAASEPDCKFLLYCDRPLQLPFDMPAHWTLRTGNVRRRALSTPFAQAVFPLWSSRDRIDVFWSPRHHLPLLLPRHVRKVVTVHDLVWKRYPRTMTTGGRLIESLLMPASLHCADRIITVSEFTRSEVMAVFPAAAGKIDVIYEASALQPGAGFAPAQYPPPTARRYFLFVGSSEPRKNLPRLLQAYRQYRSSVAEPADLVLAGSYQWGEFDPRTFAAEHDLSHCMHILRDVDDPSLAALYAHAHALVMPSLYEGFGLPLAEAMHWGVPVITSENSAMAEVAADAALLVDPLSTESIQRALHDMAENTALHERLHRAASARSAQFDWQAAATRTLALLDMP
jgi:glycosyltransferase involved in cell wall biosynthesis